MTLVKICGIRNIHEAEYARNYGAWAIGQVFAPSRRRIPVAEAAQINELLGPTIIKVGVFVDESELRVIDTIASCHLDMVQLHGSESPDYCASMPVPVIKAFRPVAPVTAVELERWPVRACLFDSGHGQVYGGSGQLFNHEWIKELAGHPRLMIAGGLHHGNVTGIIRNLKPMAVDVSSGVEFPQGGKNPVMIKLFMDKVKEAAYYAERQ